MKPVLVLEHQHAERLAYLGTWLQENNIEYHVFNAAREQFPQSMNDYAALAVMGGGMSANDDLASNRQAEQLILQAMQQGKPVIGHCLGGQLMARALGAKITTSPQPEIGWQPIAYTDHPAVNHWFGSDPSPQVIHWHYEAFDLPEGAIRLAGSAACPNQAFAIGPHLAMQFHIEIDADKCQVWINDTDPKWEQAQVLHESVQSAHEIMAGITPNLAQHQVMARAIYSRWIANAR